MSQATDLAIGAEAPFWDAMLAGKLSLQRCAACETWHWPAVWRCSACGSWEHGWEDVPMHGEVYTWSRNWHPFDGIERIGLPFVTLVVKLDGGGGARLMGLLEGNYKGVAIGAKVTGRVARTPYADRDVPSIRWSLL